MSFNRPRDLIFAFPKGCMEEEINLTPRLKSALERFPHTITNIEGILLRFPVITDYQLSPRVAAVRG